MGVPMEEVPMGDFVKNDETMLEPLAPILHNEHSSGICAFQVQMAFERNEFLRLHNFEMLQKNAKLIEENGRVKLDIQRVKLEHNVLLREHNKMKTEVDEITQQLQIAERKAQSAVQEKSTVALALEDLHGDIDRLNKFIAGQKDHIRRQDEELDKIKAELAKALEENQLLAKVDTSHQEDKTEREKELARREEEIERKSHLVEEKMSQLEEMKETVQLWLKDRELFEIEMGHLRETNRNLRFKITHPNNKSNTENDTLRNNLMKAQGREEELRRQLLKMEKDNIEMQLQLKEHNIRTSRRMSYLKPTIATFVHKK